jgi:hypothetical protein
MGVKNSQQINATLTVGRAASAYGLHIDAIWGAM